MFTCLCVEQMSGQRHPFPAQPQPDRKDKWPDAAAPTSKEAGRQDHVEDVQVEDRS